jgi:hypothetical protein
MPGEVSRSYDPVGDRPVDYPPLTVADVKRLCLRHGAEFAVVVTCYGERGTLWTTYGTFPEAKVCASDLSEQLSACVNAGHCPALNPATGPETVRESFKLDAARIKAENERLVGELAAAKEDYIRACQTVAEMHAAAVGEVRGPRIGVVEDVVAIREQRDRLLAAVRSASSSLSQSATYEVPPVVVRDVADRLQEINQELNLP